jgi:hypothetical protein
LYFGRIKYKRYGQGQAEGILFPNLPKAPNVGSNTMDTSQNDDLKFYESRIEEFDRLIVEAKSQTLISLLNQAKIKSEKAIEMLIHTQRATIIYLKAYEIKNEEELKKYKKQIELQSVEIKKLKTLQIDSDLKKSILQIHETAADIIDNSLHKREELKKLTFNTFTLKLSF